MEVKAQKVDLGRNVRCMGVGGGWSGPVKPDQEVCALSCGRWEPWKAPWAGK